MARLDWMLEGHFGDEEDDVFAQAAEMLSPELLADMAGCMLELDSALGES